MEKSNERTEVLNKIKLYESQGMFDKDVENDPPYQQLKIGDVDFLNEKFSSRVKTKIANFVGYKFYKSLLNQKQYIFKEVVGVEKLENIKGGAIVTCNHISVFDNFAVQLALKEHFHKFNLYKIVREGNYFFPGKIGFIMRNCNTLPLSSSTAVMTKCMRAVDTVLNRGDFVLVYPEQAMWQNYRKPRPLKDGAYKIATKNLVPIIPMFITLEDSNLLDKDGFPVQQYTVHIQDIIYPNASLSLKENISKMKNKNFELNKNTYENFYKTTLHYEKLINCGGKCFI